MPTPDLESKITIVLIRGGGDLASGVAVRLQRAGIKLIITELARPLAVRRLVAFSEAIYRGQITIEGVTGRCVQQPLEALRVILGGEIPVLVDPELDIRFAPQFELVALVDARMRKRPPDLGLEAAPLVIGLGPGFVAGENCHAVIETNRGHNLGRVLWEGAPEADTGVPGKVGDHQHDRVLRAPADGDLRALTEIGSQVAQGSLIATVAGEPILAPFDGVLRGLLRDGMAVKRGMKTGDLDPRNDPRYAVTVSEKSLAIGGGVLETLLTRPEIRVKLWN
jgi:xanthine dehydrogenase accessory factor